MGESQKLNKAHVTEQEKPVDHNSDDALTREKDTNSKNKNNNNNKDNGTEKNTNNS